MEWKESVHSIPKLFAASISVVTLFPFGWAASMVPGNSAFIARIFQRGDLIDFVASVLSSGTPSQHTTTAWKRGNYTHQSTS